MLCGAWDVNAFPPKAASVLYTDVCERFGVHRRTVLIPCYFRAAEPSSCRRRVANSYKSIY